MKPLAERLRPNTLDRYIGQKHLVGENGILRSMIANKRLSSFILWGPPGVGKTTLAKIIANEFNVSFYTLSAINSGVKEVREVLESAKKQNFFNQNPPILFIDEIHRFSKSQQDSLLSAVETGIITLIGATTENPSFEVIRPLLSRCQVYTLESLSNDELLDLLHFAIKNDVYLKEFHFEIKETDALVRYSGGDARKFLGIIDLIINTAQNNNIVIDNDTVCYQIQHSPMAYDKNGEMHYDLVSALIKSIRGSNPDAAIYWLARMIEGGEDPVFIARRLIISAAEDIGLANPNALLLANATFETVQKIGLPECRIPLAETTIYLATCAKSNSAYSAINQAIDFVRHSGNIPVPLHLRNAPTKLLKDLGYSENYKYPHDYKNNFVRQNYFPEETGYIEFWNPGSNASEASMKSRLEFLLKESTENT